MNGMECLLACVYVHSVHVSQIRKIKSCILVIQTLFANHWSCSIFRNCNCFMYLENKQCAFLEAQTIGSFCLLTILHIFQLTQKAEYNIYYLGTLCSFVTMDNLLKVVRLFTLYLSPPPLFFFLSQNAILKVLTR